MERFLRFHLVGMGRGGFGGVHYRGFRMKWCFLLDVVYKECLWYGFVIFEVSVTLPSFVVFSPRVGVMFMFNFVSLFGCACTLLVSCYGLSRVIGQGSHYRTMSQSSYP